MISLLVLALWSACGALGLVWETRLSLRIEKEAPDCAAEDEESGREVLAQPAVFLVVSFLVGPLALATSLNRHLCLAKYAKSREEHRRCLEANLVSIAAHEASLQGLADLADPRDDEYLRTTSEDLRKRKILVERELRGIERKVRG